MVERQRNRTRTHGQEVWEEPAILSAHGAGSNLDSVMRGVTLKELQLLGHAPLALTMRYACSFALSAARSRGDAECVVDRRVPRRDRASRLPDHDRLAALRCETVINRRAACDAVSAPPSAVQDICITDERHLRGRVAAELLHLRHARDYVRVRTYPVTASGLSRRCSPRPRRSRRG